LVQALVQELVQELVLALVLALVRALVVMGQKMASNPLGHRHSKNNRNPDKTSSFRL